MQFAGLLGDPRKTQDVYVLTSEYNRLSTQGQATSIDNLNSGLSTETIDRKNGDTTLQNNINQEAVNRINGDNYLNNRIDDVSNRVSKLEKTQYVIENDFRIFDNKHITISPFIRENITRSKMDTVGIRFTIKIGKSYEEKLIENTNARVTAIETKLGIAPIIEKTIDSKGHLTSVKITNNNLLVERKF